MFIWHVRKMQKKASKTLYQYAFLEQQVPYNKDMATKLCLIFCLISLTSEISKIIFRKNKGKKVDFPCGFL